MRITLEMPNKTSCAFINYIYGDATGMSMAVRTVSTDDLHSGEIIKCEPNNPQGSKGNEV